MSISIPSKEIYAVDVPEVKNLSVQFNYNFFVPDESVNDSGGIPEQYLTRPAGTHDTSFMQIALTRTPRFVKFNFTPAKIVEYKRQFSDTTSRDIIFDNSSNEPIITQNINNIMTEDQFSSNGFVSVDFHDGELDNKIYDLVSGSLEQHSLDDERPNDTGGYRSANRLRTQLPQHIKPHFLYRSLSLPKRSGTSFLKSEKSKSSPSGNKSATPPPATSRNNTKKALNTFYSRLHNVTINTQINTKLFADVVGRSIKDPGSPYANDMHALSKYSRSAQSLSKGRTTLQVNPSDYQTFVSPIDIQVSPGADNIDRNGGKIIGYIIDKIEIDDNGKIRQMDPIIIENPRIGSALDFRVLYGSTYCYSIRTIAQFTMPAIDADTDDVATIKLLVSSKPSHKVYVKCIESVAPPPPTDLKFTWNYETDKILVHWAFPTNSQRDIKKFQVFRRESIDHPFELIKMYDFDDSLRRYPDNENPDPSLVEFLSGPATFFIDDDFDRHTNSKFIYVVAAIDAHGFTSNFSAQFEVSFDLFKNHLVTKLVSHTGAPKPYPNLYLETDTFVDTIRASGPHSKRMKLYFNPEYYFLFDDAGQVTRTIATKQTGGKYVLQFINVDNQKSQNVTINIDDRIRARHQTINFPSVNFNRRRTGVMTRE